ncbi:MAG: YbaB/EbfC family nucleoid-associated protein [Catonella sp.]|jgi:DNA-binding YbaB/EbfC family protein|nr:YbaB/EbfC family nucleoid-associated protein [Catonella sp.]MDY6355749.1 YbaB/EbfC family nucleoid-associated protein [Catonella sp.]
MGKRSNFNGGAIPGGMNNIMKQAQRIQREMEQKQTELQNTEFTADAGGGAVSVTMNGKREILKFHISKEAVDPEDVETLEDLVSAAVNACLRRIDEEGSQAMDSITGGVNAGIGGFPF